MAERYTWDFDNAGTKSNIDVFGNFDPDNVNTSIREVVIAQHGNSRGANGTADAAIRSAQLNGEKPGEYGVVAVEFSVSGEQKSGEPYWSSGGWKEGSLSPDSAFGPRISSFTVMDKLVQELSVNLPNVEKIVFAGHSAGGQFMNRYGAGGDFTPLDAKGVDYHVVAANPSSWMEFDPSIPYKYGTGSLNDYMTKTGGHSGLADQMSKMDFAVFVGSEDTFNEGDLDTSSRAMRQGDNRFERGEWYFDHLQEEFPNANHVFEVAEGVGHTVGGMFRHQDGQDLLWDSWDMA